MNKESWCLMNLSNKTDQWKGKFEVKAKEKQLNMLQSAEVGNDKVLCQMSECLTLALQMQNYMVKYLDWVQILAPACTICGILGKLFKFSEL